jgi:cold shock CspA family protein
MATSQETYLKKDKEKNKQKKKQDKLLKKEERKASSKGGSLESMMAYVDEFGNITDEPIDPKARKSVNAESIEIGIQRREEEPEEKVRKGKVAFFNTSKGYGFIKPDQNGPDVFVHVSEVEGAGLKTLNEGQRLEYDLVTNKKNGKTSKPNSKQQ